MSVSAARDRLIVALDMPTLEGARMLVSQLDDTVTFYKVGLELAMAGGLHAAAEREGAAILHDRLAALDPPASTLSVPVKK